MLSVCDLENLIPFYFALQLPNNFHVVRLHERLREDLASPSESINGFDAMTIYVDFPWRRAALQIGDKAFSI